METEDQIPGELSLEEAPLKWQLNLGGLRDEGLCGEMRANEDELRLLTQMLQDDHDLEVRYLSCSHEIVAEKTAGAKNANAKNANAKNASAMGREEFRGHFKLRAELKQSCVITLERIDTLVDEEFSLLFSSKRPRSRSGTHSGPEKDLDQTDLIADPFEEDVPVRINKGKISTGPLICQYLSMAIDANPRKDGAQFDEKGAFRDEQDTRSTSPFIVLEQYRQKK